MTTPPRIGAEAIRAALTHIPAAPGVYQMIAVDGSVLYVGKAKNLKNRVTSYTLLGNLNTRILRMVEQVTRVEVTSAASEAEALLIESALIKQKRPHYNILLKDDKSFPQLFISTHAFPRIAKHRGARTAKGDYFGPFASIGALNQTLALLQKIFQLRPCADSMFANRSRPCLQYQIKRCSAPCVGYVTPEEYGEQLGRARDFLRGKHRELQTQFSREMQEASDAMEYEKAAGLRDRIAALTQVQQEQQLNAAGMDDADVIALARRGNRSVVQLLFYRQGNFFGQQSFHPRHEADDSDPAVMASFINQFYQSHTPPPEILLSHEPEERALIAESLAITAAHAVDLRVPQRGDKRSVVEQAEANANAALAREEQERASVAQHLASLQQLFGLPAAPTRIEVYDNSHIMGTNAIGAMIVATPEGFEKRSYRTFTIKDAATIPGDDFGMMHEVLTRRFKGHAADSLAQKPSLLLIDGGKGQLSTVQAALDALGVTDIPIVSIAKGEDRNAGREWFFMAGREPFQLPINDPTLHYLQRLRDEAHRFAIGTHRKKRAKQFTVSALDDIPGIGAARKKALLHHFGSRTGVEAATLAELENVGGISKKTAKVIFDYFHG